jgi:murein DD-endopeptidase MepM/ murein hydrolase activator NlpD
VRTLPVVIAPPVRGAKPRVSSVFGASRDGGKRGVCGGGHCGVDIRVPAGTPVVALDSGVLSWHTDHSTNETFAILSTADDWQWRYFHITDGVAPGPVRAGDVIARVAQGGKSGPHLHLGLYDGRASVKALTDRAGYVDPLPVLLTII